MRTPSRFLLSLFLFGALASAAPAVEASAPVDEPLRNLVAQVSYPPLGVDLAFALGTVDGVGGRPAHPDNPFRIASVTKTFTAAAVLKRFEDGHLDLDDPIASRLSRATADLLRQGGADPAAITVRQLLAHRSGLFDYAATAEYFAAVSANPRKRWSRREQLRFALELTPPIPPDLAYVYADTNYLLLGEILERSTGRPLAAALRSTLGYGGLGLRNTYLESLEPVPPGTRPRLHQFAFGQDLFGFDPSYDLWGGGGLVSTVGDLARFYRALFQGRVLSPTTLATMTEAVSGGGFAEEAYALGIVPFYLGNAECFGHEGFGGVIAGHCPSLDYTFAVSIGNNLFPGTTLQPSGLGHRFAELLGIDLTPVPFGPAFRRTRCTPELAASVVPLSCGLLVVEESRGQADSARIELAVALARHPEASATLDPLLVLGGGPGEPLLPSAAALLAEPALALPLTEGQDVVFVEQRGVGASSPRLSCDTAVVDLESAAACAAKFQAAGVDLARYNSLESAADLDELRTTLGYARWNLIGFSYGTRLALTMVRERPETIASLVLDGAFPPEVAETDPLRLAEVVRRVMAACAAEPACASAFPNLEARLTATLTSLNLESLAVNGNSVRGDDLVLALASFQTQPEAVEYLPAVLDAFARRDAQLLEALFPAVDPEAGFLPDTSSGAMYLSVTCNEEYAFLDRDGLAAMAAGADPLAGAWARSALLTAEVCDLWPSGQAPPREAEPVETELPTLVLNGAYDLQTPPQHGQALASRLPNARSLDFPANGHVATQQAPECALALTIQLQRTGDPAAVDASCVEAQPAPGWRTSLDEGFWALLTGG